MPLLSINELHKLTGKTRATVTKSMDGLTFQPGPKSGKLYDSKLALAKLYGVAGEDGTGSVTAQEASRLLTIARRQQIDLEMEVTRKERIPLNVLTMINERIFSNIAGMLKATEGKVMTHETISDLFSELKSYSEKFRIATCEN
jgi:hypothetical protein